MIYSDTTKNIITNQPLLINTRFNYSLFTFKMLTGLPAIITLLGKVSLTALQEPITTFFLKVKHLRIIELAPIKQL